MSPTTGLRMPRAASAFTRSATSGEDARRLSFGEKLRVTMVSGSWPPAPCGVGDYAERLVGALRQRGVLVRCIGGRGDWGWGGALDLCRQARDESDLIHIQYPTMGYGRSLVPALLPVLAGGRPVVVTLHEFACFNRLRRPWFTTFAHGVEGRIFTSERERDAFAKALRPLRGTDRVVPIASNIGRGRAPRREPGSICYFGLFSPGKGIETFLDLAELCAGRLGLSFTLIGGVTDMYRDYAAPLLDRARRLGVDLKLNLAEAEVADILSAQQFAYLPFPQGATLSRGSLLAVLRNEVSVLTTHSAMTPQALKDATVEVTDPASALKQILRLKSDPASAPRAGHLFAREAEDDWLAIADAHVAFFHQLLARKPQHRFRARTAT